MSTDSDLPTSEILQGDCRNVMADLPDESIHAIVTDPPYGLAFMSRSWDDFEPREYQQWCENWSRQCLDLLKPGGHLLAFSGNRTHHRLFSGVEDAGFTVRDTLTWHYGSGFPKSLDVGKSIDKKLGKDDGREVVGEYESPDGTSGESDGQGVERMSGKGIGGLNPITAPATPEAAQWDGFKTHLKPATEFVVVARKPLEGTVAENVLEHGTGALNIDDCRIPTDETEETDPRGTKRPNGDHESADVFDSGDGSLTGGVGDVGGGHSEGRYPANVIFDELAAGRLDEDVGLLKSGSREAGQYEGAGDTTYGDYADTDLPALEGTEGGPSRYFYTSKASKSERTLNGKIDNAHPTVKPADLMEWLIQLVTAENQIVLDPFAGTGTTCRAAKDLNRRWIGIEQQKKWSDVARVRCGLTPEDPSHVRADDTQRGLEVFVDD